jgi:hypothetical protein
VVSCSQLSNKCFCCGKIWGALWLAKELLTFEEGHSSLEEVNITYHFLPLIQHVYMGTPLSSYSLYNKWANRRCQTILATQNNVPIWRRPCVVIYSYSTTNNMHLLSHIIYSCKTLYMFRMVFPSIIRSSILRIQQWYMSNSCCYLLLSGMRWNSMEFRAPDDGRKDRPKHVERFTRINNMR